MRTLLLLASACAMAYSAESASIHGSVLDPSNRPVARAEVSLFPRIGAEPMRVLTGEDGLFRFNRLEPGEYVLEARAPGFARYRSNSVRVDSGAGEAVQVPLALARVEQEVVVTASGTPQSVDEVSKSITVVDRESMGQRDVYPVAEAVRNAPGVRVQQLGGPGSFTTLRIRGLRTEDTGILLDGFRFRDPTSPQGDASGFIEDLMVTDADRIEVLRGAASALYGSHAIGGVVNIVSDPGGGALRGSVLLEGGGLGLFRGRAQMAGGAWGNRVQYSAGFAHLNVTSGVDGDDPARNTSGQGYIGYRITPGTQISARFFGAGSYVKLNSEPEAAASVPAGIVPAIAGRTFTPGADDPDSSRVGRFTAGSVRLSGQAGHGLGYSLGYQGLNTNAHFPNGPAGSGFQPAGNTDRENDGTTHIANARVQAPWGAHQLWDAGYEFENERYFNRNFAVPPDVNSVVDVAENSHSVFVQDQVRLGERLQMAGAFRAQWFGLSRPVFTPTAAAPYQNTGFAAPPAAYTGDGSAAYFVRRSGTKLRGHGGRGYRAPSLYERFGTFYGSFGYSVYGDPRLRPNRSMGVDGGVEQGFAGGRVQASATYFYSRLQQVIGFGAIGNGDPYGRFIGYLNEGGGLARGVEASVSAAATRSLELTSAYTFTNSRQRLPVAGNVTRSLGIPDHQFTLTATQHVGRSLYVNTDFIAASNYLTELFDANFAAHAYRFAGMKKVDVGASYRWRAGESRGVRLFGKVENAFNQRYYEAGFRTPGVFATGGVQYSF